MSLGSLLVGCFLSVFPGGTDSAQPAAPAAPVQGTADEELLKGLIATLDETTSTDTFRLTVQVLASFKGGDRAIPAILRSAERLGISKGMGSDRSQWTREQQALAAVLRPEVETLHIWLRHTVPSAKVEVIPAAQQVFVLTGSVAKERDLEAVLSVAQMFLGDKLVNALRIDGVSQVQLDLVIAHISSKDLPRIAPIVRRGEGHPASNSSMQLVGSVDDQQQLLALLQSLRQQGRAKILAEPRLMTMSGRPASFQSGGRLDLPEPSNLGTSAVRQEAHRYRIKEVRVFGAKNVPESQLESVLKLKKGDIYNESVAFENFGIQVNFLPILLENHDHISLEVELNESTVDAGGSIEVSGVEVPAFDSKQFRTTAEMKPGQTLVLAGAPRQTADTRQGQRQNTTLILVTPRRIDPATASPQEQR